MHFVMPSRYTMATLPRPKDERVKLRELPPQRMAVVKFSGLAGEGKVKEKTGELEAWMKAEGLEAAGAPQLARYDPPWTLPFLRRNEVMVPLR
jgi:SOUL heme-binding protein